MTLAFALVFAGVTMHACGKDGDNALLAPGADDEPRSGLSPVPGFSISDELSPWGAHSPFQGSNLELDSFPLGDVVTGGPGKDGIPALTNPVFVEPTQVSYLAEDDLVLGLVVDGVARAYPENIGWRHEIINDEIAGFPVSVTFCPLTGTGLAFKAADEGPFTLGVSGGLFNSNLVMYDRRDDETLYPQMFFTGITGNRKGESLTLLPITETTWRTWKRLHPETEVVGLGEDTFSRESAYTVYPYTGYLTTEVVLFPLDPSPRLNPNPHALDYGRKSPLLGVRLNGEAKAYVFEEMGDRVIIHDHLGGVDILVVWDQESYLALPYSREVEGQSLTFEIVADGFPFSLIDSETGSLWDINGVATDGAMAGVRLEQIPAHNSFWFAWVTFWQETEVWRP